MLDEELQIITRDPVLPGLSLLFDEAKLLNVLKTHLPNLSIINLRRCYLRYKQGTNCLIRLQLSTADNEITLYAKAYRQSESHRLYKDHKPKGFKKYRLVIPEYSVVVFLFPLDKKLRALTKLMTPRTRGSLLRRVVSDADELSTCSLKMLHYKPERRFVALLEDINGRRAILKLYTHSRYQQALNASRQTINGQRILSLIGHSKKHHILVYRWLPGIPLNEAWLHSEFNPNSLDQVGQKLARFHKEEQSSRCSPRNTERYCASLMQFASNLAHILPHMETDIDSVAKKIAYEVSRLNSPMTRIHGDFYAEQVLLLDTDTTIIDLDDSCYWYPACDLGLFIAHLELSYLNGQITRKRVERYTLALLNGYQKVKSFDLNEVWLFCALGLLKQAQHPFRNCGPYWPELTVDIIQKSKQTLQKALSFQQKPSLVLLNNVTIQPEKLLDSSIPYLDKLQDIEYIEPYIINALLDRYPELSNTRLIQVIPLRHKRGKRALFEYVFEPCGNDNTKALVSIIGKVRAKSFDKRTWIANCELSDSGFCRYPPHGTQIPAPLGALPEYQIWFQHKITGQPLFSEFCGEAGHQLAQRVAKAIFHLHTSSVTVKKNRTIQDEINTLDQVIKIVSLKKPQWQARLADLIVQCRQLASKLPFGPQLPIHRDFYHDQILVTSDALYLLDLDLLSIGDPALDLGNFIAHIQEQCLREHNDLHYADHVLECFISYYESLSNDSIRLRVEIYRLLTMVRHIYISQRIESRNTFSETILNYCERTIEEFVSHGLIEEL